MAKETLEINEQKGLKGLSKVISFISNLSRVFIYIGIVSLILCMLLVPTFMKHVKTTDNEIIFSYSKEKVSLVKNESNQVKLVVNDKEEEKIDDAVVFNKIKKVLDKHSTNTLIGYIDAIILLLILYMYLITLVLKHLGRLFKNISNDKTPFTLDNIDHMKKMGIYMIIAILLPTISSILFNIFTDIDLRLRFDLIDIVQILFILAMRIIFKYGFILQESSKKTIYDEEE